MQSPTDKASPTTASPCCTHTGQRKCQIGSDCWVSPDQNKNESTVMVTSSTNDVRLRCVGRVPMKDISIPLRIFCSQSTGPCMFVQNYPQMTHNLHTYIYIYTRYQSLSYFAGHWQPTQAHIITYNYIYICKI